jgi:hypothetical protein
MVKERCLFWIWYQVNVSYFEFLTLQLNYINLTAKKERYVGKDLARNWKKPFLTRSRQYVKGTETWLTIKNQQSP